MQPPEAKQLLLNYIAVDPISGFIPDNCLDALSQQLHLLTSQESMLILLAWNAFSFFSVNSKMESVRDAKGYAPLVHIYNYLTTRGLIDSITGQPTDAGEKLLGTNLL